MLNHLFHNKMAFFQLELNQIANENKESELEILFALNDLFPESFSENTDFVQSGLSYLKHHYGLSKAGWQVLLKLNSKIPDFTERLSKFETITLCGWGGIDKKEKLRNQISLNHSCPVGDLPFIQNLRPYNLQKIFSLISTLSANFGVDGTCRYIGLFISEFDTRESAFSINTLYDLHRAEHENLPTQRVNTFSGRLENIYRLPHVLKRLSWHYVYTNHNLYPNYDVKQSTIQLLNFLKIQTDEPMHFFFDLIYTYQKYTPHSFLSFDGIQDIQSQIQAQTIEADDQYFIDFLLTRFQNYQHYNESLSKVTIELVRLASQYEHNVDKGLDKLEILTDYLNRSEDFQTKLMQEKDFSLNKLLQWSNQWHVKGESRGELKEFENYQIDRDFQNYRFEQIKNTHELHEEGHKQSHCVYSYEKDCLKGETIIVSMKDVSGKRISTLRFQKSSRKALFKKTSWSFVENRKRFNHNCNSEEKQVAQEYFNQIKHHLT